MIDAMLEKDRFAKMAGLEMVEVGGGKSYVKMAVRDCHLNALDMVHGGAVFTLGDYAFALASNSVASPSVALSVNIQFLRPGKAGVLHARARELSSTGRVASYLVEITDDEGEMVASFQGLAYILKPRA